MKRHRYIMGLWLICSFLSLRAVDPVRKEKFLNEVIFRGLEGWHYAPLKLDDAFSRKAFEEFEHRLDQTKSFLIQGDIEELLPFSDRIDDQVLAGSLDVAKLGARLLGSGSPRCRRSAAIF